ncbi:guanine nucleotide exchange factor [Crepidotus variabilis]|uniref:Guanine nucleotide exchange factor n=1 Tax=Crepidotus variabilis TaxID=179855 RepID=A0A9P6EUI4_9AGAR|nr:guanine nucleotide exchange factor [Crepidotus variabilis]
MNDILKSYNALSSSSSRSDVSNVLNSIINASPFTFDRESRTELIKNILQDLKSQSTKSKLTSKDAALALLAVKTLGKDPSGSAFLASSTNLSTLLGFATTMKDDQDASCEALRCIANALLLVEGARSTFITKEVNGGDTCITMLEKSSSPDTIFILARILFLSTASGPSYIETVVDGKFHGRTIVEILGSKLDLMTSSLRNNTPVAKEAIVDILKFVFNLVLHYPKMVDAEPQHSESHNEKVIGDFWSPKLDGLLPALLRTFASLPPTSPAPLQAPLTHVIHSLITIPINSSLKPLWFGQAGSSSARSSTSNSPKSRSPHESAPESRSDSPTRSHQPGSPIISTLDRALSSVLSAGRRSLSRTSSPGTSFPPIDVLQRAYELLDQSFLHYFPGDVDVDHISVRERVKAETTDSLDDILSPLVVLVTRICLGDEGSKVRVKQWLIPDDLDRTSPLEQRSDLLGRCLRLLSSVYHPRVKDACGELLYALSDSNATTLSALVGYGNVAGFLFHKGVLSAPVPNESSSTNIPTTTGDGVPLNPITGIAEQPKLDLPEMTEEEKEREMEKLFVLFDRLEKTGALPKENNPIRKAIHEGKMG